MQEENGDVTELLRKWREGGPCDREPPVRLVLPHLRQRGRALLSKERRGQPLRAAELVNDVYSALVRAKDLATEWKE
jgi:hypothetical protein